MTTGESPKWRRPKVVIREIKKAGLTADEAAALAKLMSRYLEGRTFPKDHKSLRGGVEELRLDGNRRIFRLYFAHVSDGLVLLCLHFKAKKKDLDKDAIDLAAERLKRWHAGEFDVDLP